MGLIIADRVRETSTTSGTGQLTLAGAVTGFRTFASVCSIGDEVQYVITEGALWEVGVGIYSGQLVRSTVLASSNAGSLVSFTGASKDVVLTLPARAAAGIPNRNLLVNSSFRIWQRGTSLTLADGAMGPDGWFLLSESGSVTCAPGSNFYGVGVGKYAVAGVTSTQRVGFGQVLFSQDAYDLDNFWFQCDVFTSATKTVRAAVLYGGGTTDAQTRDMVNNWASTTYTAGNFFHANWVPLAVAQGVASATGYRFSFPVTVPGGHKNLGVLIWTETQLTSGNEFYIGEPILSDAGCPQIYLPPSYSDELTACLARYTKTFGLTTAPVQNIGNAQGALRATGNGSGVDIDWRFPVPMRKIPTITTFNPLAANANWRDQTASADRTVTLGTATTSAVAINAGSTTSGNQMSIHATAEAEPCS
jgi:hypothetical protein